MQNRFRWVSKLVLIERVAQKAVREQAQVNLICLMKFKNKINFNKKWKMMQGASIISTFQFTSACDETWVVAFDTGLVASERRCEWPSRDMSARLSKRVSPRLPTKLDKVLTSNLWESMLPILKIYSNVSKKDTYGGGNHQSAPSTHAHCIIR